MLPIQKNTIKSKIKIKIKFIYINKIIFYNKLSCKLSLKIIIFGDLFTCINYNISNQFFNNKVFKNILSIKAKIWTEKIR